LSGQEAGKPPFFGFRAIVGTKQRGTIPRNRGEGLGEGGLQQVLIILGFPAERGPDESMARSVECVSPELISKKGVDLRDLGLFLQINACF